jgi:S-adenosylmethionine:tRNA ribosyltransferase-isomerase
VRALESAWDPDRGEVVETRGATSLYILPGYQFNVVDALVTNFHVPRSTLLMLVSAFAGRTPVMEAYELAMSEGYRFLSFGDAMLVV